MEAIKFNLKGATGFFKNPVANMGVFFTYPHIHKINILGILGAISGFGGYTNQTVKQNYDKKNDINRLKRITTNDYPEFYEKLKDLKISIIPKKNPIKKINFGIEGAGIINKDGNTIFKEEWLFDLDYEIIILSNHSEYEKIKEVLLTENYKFFPYFGQNTHPCDIENVEIIELNLSKEKEVRLESFYSCLTSEVPFYDFDEPEDNEIIDYNKNYVYYLPTELTAKKNNYIISKIYWTYAKLMDITIEKMNHIYTYKDKYYYFI